MTIKISSSFSIILMLLSSSIIFSCANRSELESTLEEKSNVWISSTHEMLQALEQVKETGVLESPKWNLVWFYVLCGFGITLFFAFFIKVSFDNFILFRNQKNLRKELITSLGLSFLLWFPMLFPICAGLWFNNTVDEQIEKALYVNGFIIAADTAALDFTVDVDTSLTLIFAELRNRAILELDSIRHLSSTLGNTLPTKVGSSIRNIYSPSNPHIMGIPHTKSWRVSKRAKKKTAQLYNKLSIQLTNQTNESIKASIDNLSWKAEDGVEVMLKKSKAPIHTIIDSITMHVDYNLMKAQQTVYKSVVNTYYSLQLSKLIFDLLLIIAIIKSFLYVFARILFRQNKGLAFNLWNTNNNFSGHLSKHSKEYRIAGQSQQKYYVNRNLALNGAHPMLWYAQPFSCFFSRFINSVYGLDMIDMKKKSAMVTFSQAGGLEFIEYDLLNGEQCIFHFKDFIGMTSTVRLQTKYAFHLPAFLMEKNSYSVAKGPGKLILRSDGNSTISPANGCNRSISLSRIIAFQNRTEFNVSSQLRIVDMFFSDFHVKKKNSGNIVINGNQRAKRRSGIVRFFIRFLLPF